MVVYSALECCGGRVRLWLCILHLLVLVYGPCAVLCSNLVTHRLHMLVVVCPRLQARRYAAASNGCPPPPCCAPSHRRL